jgi:hypothetical protein
MNSNRNRKRVSQLSALAVFGCLSMLLWRVAAGGVEPETETTLDWTTIDGGGGRMVSADDSIVVQGTMGQPDAGPVMTGGEIRLTGGFWSISFEPTFLPGDSDGDNDVDIVDFGAFQLCFTGSGETLAPGCEWADFDGDGDVDLIDFGAFQIAFTG